MEHKHESDNTVMNSKTNIAFIVFLGIGAYFLITEHWAHLSGLFPYWPYLLFLACPLMHILMHGGHGHGNYAPSATSNASTPEKK